MKRFLVATACAVLIGVALGATARLIMRLITLVEGDEPEFTIGATAGIISFFVLAALGGAWGGLLTSHRRIGLAIAVLMTFPVTFLGAGIGGGDLVQSVEDQSPGVFALIVLGTLLIAACVFASPTLSWRRAAD
ncbi:hypothetical protein J2X11_001616 [Aeromicrobium panaciterrae]|uniref:Fluoride ion transporter CrcB n=1 Tax=Aeromicrobium panaciterrae TaxID=363861 RepID=A0ABU1UNM2_9ACTN|nr:hypothetical protein [Aeromicrobium panaciterrae]MDR7086777.1 hypothetical protein [Aeromicrobium panaciterrae]